jgi:hypothetical protein
MKIQHYANQMDKAFLLPSTCELVLWTTHLVLGNEPVQFFIHDTESRKYKNRVEYGGTG